MFPDAHSDPRTWHTPSPLETRRCVERRASLSHRARLSLANATSAPSGTADRQTPVPIRTARVRRTPRPDWWWCREVVTETTRVRPRARRLTVVPPPLFSRATRHDRLHHG